MEERDIAIQVKNVSKEFRVFRSNHQRTIFELLGRDRSSSKLTALTDINFTLHKGEKLAIMGNIGAGRSTLLKIIAGVTFPTTGTVVVNGNMQSIIDLRVGFDNMLTGRENIRIKGSIMGWTKEEMMEREEEIIHFAQLEEIIDHPIRTYQGGEAGRLGFAMYTTGNPDILIMDQGFAVGEPVHKDKCIERIYDMISADDMTYIFVTNTTKYIRKLCNRAIILEEGKICYDGEIEGAIVAFREEYKRTTEKEKERKTGEFEEKRELHIDSFSEI